MADIRVNVKNANIANILQSMDYGDVVEKTELAKQWLGKRNIKLSRDTTGRAIPINDVNTGEVLATVYPPNDKTVTAAINLAGKNKMLWYDLGVQSRIKLMNIFASNIEENVELICQLELLTRGILSKDTKAKGIPLVVEYLRYYANWSARTKEYGQPKGTAAAIISDDSCLAIMGYVMGPALASGHTLVLNTGPRLSTCACLLIELAVNSGIPNSVITLVPGEDCLHTFYDDVSILSIFGNVYKKQYSTNALSGQNVISLSNFKTSMIVFNSADLDSASNCVINGVWEYQGLLPWSVNTIIVQEDIIDDFLVKLKQKISKIRLGKSNNKIADISCPIFNNANDKLQKMIKDAHAQGIEVYQPKQTVEFQPTLFIGGRVYNNNVIIQDANDIACATVLAFRTSNEAVTLSNNGKQGVGVSVWTENINLINEVTGKLKMGNIWVNCHGITNASVPYNPYKGSGMGYIGGSEGFYEYVSNKSDATYFGRTAIDSKNVSSIITSAIKAQENWYNLSLFTRAQKLSKFAQDIEANTQLAALIKFDIIEWVSTIYECITELSDLNKSANCGNYDLRTYREPLGVIVNVIDADSELIFRKTIIASLFLGNSVIILADEIETKFYSEVAKYLPAGLLATVSGPRIHMELFEKHKDVRAIISYNFMLTRPLINSKKLYYAEDNWKGVVRQVTQIKNVWLTVGESFL